MSRSFLALGNRVRKGRGAVDLRSGSTRDVRTGTIVAVFLVVGAYWTMCAESDLRPVKTPAQIARDAFPSVVLLAMEDGKGQPVKFGTGFFVAGNTIVTNLHVIDGTAAGYAKIVGQPAKLAILGVVGLDPAHDLALLEVMSSSAAALPVADKLTINVGETVYAIGNPVGLEGTFSEGIVSSVRALGSMRFLQITAPISPGSSGGPVMDQTGTVVGVAVSSVMKGQNLNFAIPAEYVALLLKNKTAVSPLIKSPPKSLARSGRNPTYTGSVTIEKTVLAKKTEDGFDPVKSLKPNDTFAVLVFLSEAKVGTKLKAVWTLVDAGGKQDQKILEKKTELTPEAIEGVKEANRINFSLAPNEPFPAGDYKVDIYLNGELAKTVPFKIK
jgi:S1-C subfamily serine protease